ncbi:MAG: PEP-CTERM sorting domain-containing protein [Acidobacteria bacterium]|nr:PEP-CTERM sorting domain-containing protein [Acidobacteriota bacterium]
MLSVVQMVPAATISLDSAIFNQGFETSTSFAVTAGTSDGTSPVQSWNLSAPGWQSSGTAGDYRSQSGTHMGNPAFIDPLEGLNIGFILPGSYLYQDLGLAIQHNTDYALSYAVGRRYDSAASNYRVVVTAGPGPFVEGQNMWTYNGNTGTIAAGGWTNVSLNFNSGSTPAAGNPFRVWLANDGGGISVTATGEALNSIHREVVFDVYGIPEPATFALFGLGLAGILLIRRKIA